MELFTAVLWLTAYYSLNFLAITVAIAIVWFFIMLLIGAVNLVAENADKIQDFFGMCYQGVKGLFIKQPKVDAKKMHREYAEVKSQVMDKEISEPEPNL